MASQQVTIARIYFREEEHLLGKVMQIVNEGRSITGATVFRGLAGIGANGKVHTASLVDLSLDLPVIVEFYDQPERVEAVINALKQHVKLQHIVTWPATLQID